MTYYGVRSEYDYNETHKRDCITVWSGPFASTLEAIGYSLPKGDGYMLHLVHGGKVRVTCPAPRTDETFEEIDAAINEALAH